MAWGRDKRTPQQRDQDDVAARVASSNKAQAVKRYEQLAQQYSDLQGDVEQSVMGSRSRNPAAAKRWSAKRDKAYKELLQLEVKVKKAYKDAGGTGHPIQGPYDSRSVFEKMETMGKDKKDHPEPWW